VAHSLPVESWSSVSVSLVAPLIATGKPASRVKRFAPAS
jgi:hypothetical protein